MRKKYIAAGLAGLMLVSSLIMNVNAGQLDPGVKSESANIPTTETIMDDDGKANAAGKWYEHVFATEALSTEAEEVTKQADVYGYIGNYNKDKTNGGTVGYFDIHGDQKTATAYAGDEDPKDADMVLSDPKFISVTVPIDICLLLVKLPETSENKVNNGVFLSPEYQMVNTGSKVDVYVQGVEKVDIVKENKTLFSDINMIDDIIDARNQFKLSIAPVDGITGNKFEFTETNLITASSSADSAKTKLGTLSAQDDTGYFTFTGTADTAFFENTDSSNNKSYIDNEFPLTTDLQNANQFIKKNARAHYKLIYKFVLADETTVTP